MGSQKTTIIIYDFLSDECYVDAMIKTDEGQLALSNCNFVKKSKLSSSHLEVFEGFKNVKVTANNCYQITKIGGFDRYNDIFTILNLAQTSTKNIGCGFENRYLSSKLIFNGPPDK